MKVIEKPRLNQRMTEERLLRLRSSALTLRDELAEYVEKIDERLGDAAPGRARARLQDGTLDPHVQAGPNAIAKVRKALARTRSASQAKLGQRTGLSSGTLSWAIRALELDGEIRPTGERDGRSMIYERVPKRRVTRMEGS